MKAAFSFLPSAVSASPSSPPLPSSPPSPSVFASHPQCQRCLSAAATIHCPSCSVLLCLPCGHALHNHDVALLQHKIRFQYAPSSPIASPAAAATQRVLALRSPAFRAGYKAKPNFAATAPQLVSYHCSSPDSASSSASPPASSLPSSLPPPLPAQPPAVPPRPYGAFMLHRPRGGSLSSAAPLAAQLQASGADDAAGCALSMFSDGEGEHRRRVQTLLQRVGEEDAHSATDAEGSPLSPITPLSARGHSASLSATALQHRSHSVSHATTPHSASGRCVARMESAAVRPHSQSVSESRIGRLHSQSLSESNPLFAVSPSRRLLAFASTPGVDGPSSSTFKLAAYSLFSSSSSLSQPTSGQPPPFTLCISPVQQTLTVTSQDGRLHHCRSFSSLSSVTQSEHGNPACFTLCFSDSRPTAQCLSPSPSEAALISSMLLSFIEQLRSASSSSPPAAPPFALLYAGSVQKRSRMRWKSLHMVVRPFLLLLYTQRQQETEGAGEGEELHRSISLQGCAVRSGLGGEGKAAAAGLAGDDKERYWTLEQREGKATLFRCLSAAERETVVAMISKAMHRTAASGKEEQEDEEQKTREAEEDNSKEEKESVGQLLSINNSTQGNQLSSTTALSASLSASHELPELNPLSPLVSPCLDSASAGSSVPALAPSAASAAAPHRSVSHARQLQLAKASRRRSRRSMSKDFRQLREREALPNIAVAQPASSSSSHLLLSPASSPLSPISDFAELPPDPRPPPSISPALSSGVYSLLSALLSSLMSGCHLTPALYVPRAVWWQTGRKVPAFDVKVECMEAVWEEAAAVLVPAEADGSAAEQQVREGEEALERVLAVMQQAQHRLSQSLPYIAQVKDRRRDAAASVGSTAGSAASSGSKKPIAALSRLLTRATDAASLSVRKLDEADTARYCQAVQQMLEAAAVFQRWHAFAAAMAGRQSAGCTLLLQHLHSIDCWLYCVLAQLLLRDLGDAIRRYVKHQYRGLTGNRSARGGGAAGGSWSRAARQPFSSPMQTEKRGH